VQFAEVAVPQPGAETIAEFRYNGGTDVYVATPTPQPGARNEGIRILRSRADATALRLLLEGRTGRSYELSLRTPHRTGTLRGATLVRGAGADPVIRVTFGGAGEGYVRREVIVELTR
jgi:hypothetical protein